MSEEITQAHDDAHTQVPDDAHIIGARAQVRDESCTIDYRLVKRLIDAGINEEVAEILAENHALQGAATAQQLAATEANLRVDLAQIDSNSNERMKQMDVNLKQMEINSNERVAQIEANARIDTAKLQKETEGLRKETAEIRIEMARMETRLTRWIVAGFITLVGLILAQTGFMLSLFTIFPR